MSRRLHQEWLFDDTASVHLDFPRSQEKSNRTCRCWNSVAFRAMRPMCLTVITHHPISPTLAGCMMICTKPQFGKDASMIVRASNCRCIHSRSRSFFLPYTLHLDKLCCLRVYPRFGPGCEELVSIKCHTYRPSGRSM